ncbi:MAG: hypothetical protein IT327_11915 [Anaerolineae bacterium]|nr:hypothetical protein [Anaerolineae bacterium]
MQDRGCLDGRGEQTPCSELVLIGEAGSSDASLLQTIFDACLLVAHTLQALAQPNFVSFYLYYVTNPLSSRFWPTMGFRPFLTTYKTKQ